MQYIDIVCDGKAVTLKPVGFKGKACRQVTEAVEKALGGSITSRTTTPEAQQTEVAYAQQQKR